MADYKGTDIELTAVANAIRSKGGTSALLEWPNGFISAIEAIPTGGGVTIVPWSTGTDAEIAAMIDAAHAGTIDLQQDGGWAVGDTRTISLAAFTAPSGIEHAAQNVDIVIGSFSDYNNCGCVLQFDFKNVVMGPDRMNDTDVTQYGTSEFKTVTAPLLVAALPSWMQSRLIEFSVIVMSNYYGADTTTVTGNKLALRARVELYGADGSANDAEGSQIDYYSSHTSAVIRKYQNGGYNKRYWLRTPYSNNQYVIIDSDPKRYSSPSSSTSQVHYAPFGCL